MGERKDSRGSAPANAGYSKALGLDRVFGIRLESLMKSWEGAKRLFDYKNTEGTLKGLLPEADRRLAYALFIAGGALMFVFCLLTTLESVYVTNLASDAIIETSGMIPPKIDDSVIPLIAVSQFLLFVPIGLLYNLAFESLGFRIANALGGRGSFDAQLYVSSVIWLSASISFVSILLLPLYCFGILALASFLLISGAYLLVYLNARSYSIVHGMPFIRALAVVILISIPKLLLWIFTGDFLSLILRINIGA